MVKTIIFPLFISFEKESKSSIYFEKKMRKKWQRKCGGLFVCLSVLEIFSISYKPSSAVTKEYGKTENR